MCFLAHETVELVIEGQMKLMESWNESLSDKTSNAFIRMKQSVEEEMDKLFCNDTNSIDLPFLNDTCHTEVTGFSNGSIFVMSCKPVLTVHTIFSQGGKLNKCLHKNVAKVSP